MSSSRGVLIRHVSERLFDPAFSAFINLIHSLATIDPKRNVEDTRVFGRLLVELEEKYRTLVLQEQSSAAAQRPGPGTGNGGKNHASGALVVGTGGGSRSGGARGAYFNEDEINSDVFVQQLHEVGMLVVQDPKAELEDKVAGLELLRCMLRFEDTNASPRRLACATLLRDVLENKVVQTGGSVVNTYIDKMYDIPVMLLAARCLGDLSAFASTIPEMTNLRKRFLEPSMDWLVDGKYAVRRLGAVLILRALASRAPTLFYEVHHQFPKGFGTLASASKQTSGKGAAHIWSVLMDKEKVEVREYAAEAYGAFLQLVHERESEDEHYQEAIQYIDTNFDRAAGAVVPAATSEGSSSGGGGSRLGLLTGSTGSSSSSKGKCGEVEVVHSSLLVLKQLLKHQGDFMQREASYSNEMYCRHLGRVLSWRLHKDERVRHTVLELVPMLAAFNIQWFGIGRFPNRGPASSPSKDSSLSSSATNDVAEHDQGKTFPDVCISHILTRIEQPPHSGSGGHNSLGHTPAMASSMISQSQGIISDRRTAYKSLGALASAAGSIILKNAAVLNNTLEAIDQGFRLRPFCDEAVECLRMVVSAAMKPHQAPPKSLERHLASPVAVKNTFRGGITANLVRTLTVVALKIPSTAAVIQQCVLEETKFAIDWFIARQRQQGFEGSGSSSTSSSSSSLAASASSSSASSAAGGGDGSCGVTPGSWAEDHDNAVALRGLAGGLSHAAAVARALEPRKDADNEGDACSAIAPSHVLSFAQGNAYSQPGAFIAPGGGGKQNRRPSLMTGMLDQLQATPGSPHVSSSGRGRLTSTSGAPPPLPPPPPNKSSTSFGSMFKAAKASLSGNTHGASSGGGSALGGTDAGSGGVGGGLSQGGNEGSHRLALELNGDPVMSVVAALHTLANFHWEHIPVHTQSSSASNNNGSAMNLLPPSQQQQGQQRTASARVASSPYSTSRSEGGWVEEVVDVVRCFVPRLLEDECKDVRLAAAQCCCTVIDRLVAPRIALQKTPTTRIVAATEAANTKRGGADARQSSVGDSFAAAAEAELVAVMCSLLEQVVMVGVADSVAEVRFRLLTCLSPSSDPLLLRSPSTALFLLAQTMHDEVFAVREAGMVVMARLAHRAPLSLMPQVRKCISNQLSFLEMSEDPRVKEEAVNLLKCVAAGAGSLLQPYVPAIMRHMLRQLLDPSSPPALVQATLAGVGELSLVSHTAVRPHLKQLMPEIIRALKDRTVLNKTAVAMKALGQIISSTGDVITPYARYPELLDTILSALHHKDGKGGEAAKRLQLEAVSTVGILGALSPEKLAELRSSGILSMGGGAGSDDEDGDYDDDDDFEDVDDDDEAVKSSGGSEAAGIAAGDDSAAAQAKKSKSRSARRRRKKLRAREKKEWQQQVAAALQDESESSPSSLAESQGEREEGSGGSSGNDVLPAPAPGEIETLAEYYPRVSLNALVKLLRHSKEVKYAVKATHLICSNFDQALLEVYLSHVMLGYMYAIGRLNMEEDIIELLFDRLCDLIRMSQGGEPLRKIMPTLVTLLDECWSSQPRKCLNVVEAVEEVLGVFDFHHHAAPLLGLLLRTMKQDRSRDKTMTLLVLNTFQQMAGRDVTENVVIPQLSLVLPDLMRVAEMPSTSSTSSTTSTQRARLKALHVLKVLIDCVGSSDLPDYASGIVLPLLRVISSTTAHESARAGGGGSGSVPSFTHSSSLEPSSPGLDPSSSSAASSSSSGASASSSLSERDTSELRNLALRCLTKTAKRLGPSYRPYIAVAKMQLAPLKRQLAAQQIKIAGGSHQYSLSSGSTNSEKVAALLESNGFDSFGRCAELDEYEDMAAGIWHGRPVFEAGDLVEARFKGQANKWVLAKVMKVGGAAPSDSGASTGVPKGSRTYDLLFYGSSDVEVGVDKSFVRPRMLGNELPRKGKSSSSSGSGGGGGSSSTSKSKKARAAAAVAVNKKSAEWGSVPREWQHGVFRRACECEKLTTGGDWTEWIRRVSVAVLEKSPCPYIQPCAAIAQVYEPLAYELFNAAFISVWNALYFDEDDKDLSLEDIPVITAMENALKSPNLPPWILTLILNLAEFMEMQGAPLPIDMELLGSASLKSHAFAKCLHYKEFAFQGMQRLQQNSTHVPAAPFAGSSNGGEGRDTQALAVVGASSAPVPPQVAALGVCVEELISVNNHLNLPEAAAGVLECSGVAQKPALLEKLGRWEKAKAMYEATLQFLEEHKVSPPEKTEEDESEEEDDDGGDEDDDEFGDGFGDLPGDFSVVSAAGGSDRASSSSTTKLSPQTDRYIKWRKRFVEAKLGHLRCLHALGDFEAQLSGSSSLLGFLTETESHIKVRPAQSAGASSPSSLPASVRSKQHQAQQGRAWKVEARRLGADAACSLQAWDSLREDPLVKHTVARHNATAATQQQQLTATSSTSLAIEAVMSNGNEEEVQTLMYAAMLAVRDVNFDGAQRFIDDARQKVAPVLSGMLDEHYGRAYGAMVTVQQLAELEEMVRFRRKEDELRRLHTPSLAVRLMSSEKRRLQAKWKKRLHHLVASDVDVWRRLVQVRSLVLPPQEDEGTWLRLAGLCRHSKRLALCENTLRRLHVTPRAPPSFVTGADGNVRLLAQVPDADAQSAAPGAQASSVAVRPSPRAAFALFDYMWEAGVAASGSGGGAGSSGSGVGMQRAEDALGRLTTFTGELLRQWQQTNDRRSKAFGATRKFTGVLNDDDEDSYEEDDLGDVQGQSGSAVLLDKDGRVSAVDDTLLVRSLLKVAEWKKHNALFSTSVNSRASRSSSSSSSAVGGGGEVSSVEIKSTVGALGEVLELLGQAKDISRHMYRAWHSWALTNHEMVKLVQNEHSKRASSASRDAAEPLMSEETVSLHITQAIGGFVKSIGLGDGGDIANMLQDTLRLLTLWFSYGHDPSVHAVVAAGIREIRVEVWLEVIPQLIARIDHHSPDVMTLLNDLLRRVAKAHPQALIYPMAVTSNTASEARRRAATRIINEMSGANQRLVDEANLVSREMMDVAITWHEFWFQGLEDAANLYFTDKDTEGMLTKLNELHDHWREQLRDQGFDITGGGVGDVVKREAATSVGSDQDGTRMSSSSSSVAASAPPSSSSSGTATIRVVSFIHAFGRDLKEAEEWVTLFKSTRDLAAINQAWDLYSSVFRRIKKQINNFESIELRHVSPKLLNARDLELAVPGTYSHRSNVVRIQGFSSTVKVITSKQRPRYMTILGSDGKAYPFLLKGHEDLRQDERVMQLFRLINALLGSDPSTAKSALHIKRYSVMPLSNNSGVIGWVRNCDTLQKLVKDYRESRNIPMDLEKRLIWGINVIEDDGNSRGGRVDFDKLSTMQKVEVFGDALGHTQGQDISTMLWLRSPSSEVWLGRRTTFTRSLATMCMAGYILGLGDRHPSNLMLERTSGRVVHIDFGDCFEVAMERDKYPEKVPFRLTRMLVNAMEVSGIEGNYRSTCVNVMRVLRSKSDSLNAMLEAFVHDPLIGWKLLHANDHSDKHPKQQLSEQQHEAANSAGSGVVALDGKRKSLLHESTIEVNEQAIRVTRRIQLKLQGCEFIGYPPDSRYSSFPSHEQPDLDSSHGAAASAEVLVEEQVDRLIRQAQAHENLSQMFVGWCGFW